MSRATRPPLACRFGRHDPDPLPRWNEGYYFARCRRCGADLVRTIYGPWQAPKGFRIVWSSARPETVPAAPMLVEPAAAESQKPAPARPASYVPDFMDDAQADTSWRRHLPPDVVEEEAPRGADAAGASLRVDIGRLIPPLRATPPGARERRRPVRRTWFAILAFFLAATAVAFLARNEGAGAAAPSPDPTMFVTDGMTSCRAMASRESSHVRYLVRGDAVLLVGRRGSWAAISYAGQQCWVPLGLLSDHPVT